MEYYDIIIIGAGIAGTSLARSLSETCPEKKVLLIDKEEIGANRGYNSRITYSETIKEYNLPYEHVFDGLKIGNSKRTYLTIDSKFYAIDYKKICQKFYRKSSAEFRKEKAEEISPENIFVTDKKNYRFKYLIDCSGHKSFLSKFIKRPAPMRLWVGITDVYTGNSKLKGNYFYLLPENDGFIEDIYVRGKEISIGNWFYTQKIDFSLIKPPKNKFSSRYLSNLKPIKTEKVVVPGSPTFPMVRKNFAFLGDSFGNAFPTVGEGVRPIIKSSEILASAIKSENLRLYETQWKKEYLKKYIQILVGKINIKSRLKIGELLKDSPDIFLKLIKAEPFEIPEQVKNKIPAKEKIDSLKYYAFLKMKYLAMNFKKHYT